MHDVVIIGSGAAGLSAAIYAARLGLSAVVIGKDKGMWSHAYKIENYPGIESISGVELADRTIAQAKKLGVEIVNDEVTELTSSHAKTVNNSEFKARYFIIASGTEHRHLNLQNEDKLVGRGVCYCAICDAPFFQGKTVAVVGGGDSAFTSALLLSEHCSKVYIICREEKPRAESIWVERIRKIPKIEMIANSSVAEIKGEKVLEGIRLNNNKELKVSGLFVAIGSVPSTAAFKNLGIKTDSEGYIIVDKAQKTSVDNIYAAGDITTGSNKLRQIVTACAEGAIAAESVCKELKKSK